MQANACKSVEGLLGFRGYTSHEHFAEVGLIHMNGRLYDPLLRRFLNADENIQDMFNTQNYNKYGYVLNNPLMYNDPSGEIIPFIAAAVAWIVSNAAAIATAAAIGAAVGLAAYTVGVLVTGSKWSLVAALKATFWGGISGAVTFGIGSIFSSAAQTFGNAILQAAAHGVAQGTLSLMQGASFKQAFIAGALGSLGASAWGYALNKVGLAQFASSAVGTVAFGALSGGIGAELSGGNFWQGALIGGIVAGLNHVAHATANRLEKSDLELDLQNAKDGDPELFEKLRQHYEAKTGKTLTLTKEEFLHMMKTAVSEKLIDYSKAKCVNGNCTATVDFYKSSSNDLKLSFGRATVKFYYNSDGHAVLNGFYDKYDFDPKPWGTRSRMNEIITRAYNIYSSGKAFQIKYP